MTKKLICLLISIYQQTLSQWTPSTCRFHPSCSEHTKQSIQSFGIIKGSWLGIKQLCQCHPFSTYS